MANTSIKEQSVEFSLVRGGPLYRLFSWANLSGTERKMYWRRYGVVAAITWLPLLILSVAEGTAVSGKVVVPFFHDVLVHARFLLALPMLLYGEVFSHKILGPGMQNFLSRQIVTGDDIPRFHAVIERAHRMRDSVWLELCVAIVVCTAGAWNWYDQMVSEGASWFAHPDWARLNLTIAGYWLTFVSIPVFQFVLVRWYARFLIWIWLLWRISRFDLNLMVTHPDRSGGLAFLPRVTYSFGFVLAAQAVLLSGIIANMILHKGSDLMELKGQIAGYIVFFVCVTISPLAAFIPAMVEAKRKGLGAYGTLATRYTSMFAKKWIPAKYDPSEEELLGSPDIQSLADLGASFQRVTEMGLAPFGLRTAAQLTGLMLLPMLPLLLFVFSLADIFDKVLKAIF